ncbi:MAG: hypothetical protein JNM85_11475 [Chthonomonas sp.]|nr:hypothetical protein [Chthonomonas sp.]
MRRLWPIGLVLAALLLGGCAKTEVSDSDVKSWEKEGLSDKEKAEPNDANRDDRR